MAKPTVYLDTNVISAFHYEGGDFAGLARRNLTRDWWDNESNAFKVWASRATEDELAAGVFPQQTDCLKFVSRLPYLSITRKALELAAKLVELRAVPQEKPGDAAQMAVCAAHGIDYLLSWNYAHLVNPVAQKQLESICANLSMRPPLLVSPESIPKATLGQSIRRRPK